MKLRVSALLLVTTACFVGPAFAEEGVESQATPAPAQPAPEGAAPTVDESEADESEDAGTKADEGDQVADNSPEPLNEAESTTPPLEARERAARDAFLRGDRLYLEGDYRGAVLAFEEAYALSGRIEMLFNLANAHERLGNYSEASVALRGYIPHSPEGDRPTLERRLERFESLAEKDKTQAKETARTAKELQENPPPVPVTRTVGVGLITLGSAATINGIAFAISAGYARKKLNSLCEGEGRARLCPTEAEMPLGRDKTHSLIADISLVSGAILSATGIYLVIRSKESSGAQFGAGFGPGSVLVEGRF